MSLPRVFQAIRNQDVTGISGAGHIADGVVFEDGTTVLRWRTEHTSTAVYNSFEDMELIHGHNGATRFVFPDEPLNRAQVNQMYQALLTMAEHPAWSGKIVVLPPGTIHG